MNYTTLYEKTFEEEYFLPILNVISIEQYKAIFFHMMFVIMQQLVFGFFLRLFVYKSSNQTGFVTYIFL